MDEDAWYGRSTVGATRPQRCERQRGLELFASRQDDGHGGQVERGVCLYEQVGDSHGLPEPWEWERSGRHTFFPCIILSRTWAGECYGIRVSEGQRAVLSCGGAAIALEWSKGVDYARSMDDGARGA